MKGGAVPRTAPTNDVRLLQAQLPEGVSGGAAHLSVRMREGVKQRAFRRGLANFPQGLDRGHDQVHILIVERIGERAYGARIVEITEGFDGQRADSEARVGEDLEQVRHGPHIAPLA